MLANFPAALKFVLQSEGGNDDDPEDHGGRTSRGITQREYNAWRAEKGLPHQDVWKAGDDEVREIYHDEYWAPHCDKLPGGTDYAFFDFAITSGPFQAVKTMQRALGLTPDGRVGPITRAAMQSASPAILLQSFDRQKRTFYRSLHQPRFTKGWLNRCDDVLKNATRLVS